MAEWLIICFIIQGHGFNSMSSQHDFFSKVALGLKYKSPYQFDNYPYYNF